MKISLAVLPLLFLATLDSGCSRPSLETIDATDQSPVTSPTPLQINGPRMIVGQEDSWDAATGTYVIAPRSPADIGAWFNTFAQLWGGIAIRDGQPYLCNGNDTEMQQNLLDDRRIFVVSEGTIVVELESGGGYFYVVVVSGPQQGLKGWMHCAALVPAIGGINDPTRPFPGVIEMPPIDGEKAFPVSGSG